MQKSTSIGSLFIALGLVLAIPCSDAQGQVIARPAWADILSHMSIVFLDDGMGGTVKTIRITGVNVQVVNGLGATATMNGTGNLVVGYNEMREGLDLGNPFGNDRRGSHNIVGGRKNAHPKWGGLVVGDGNTATGAFSSVSGGRDNTVTYLGYFATVSGGLGHSVTNPYNWQGGQYYLPN